MPTADRSKATGKKTDRYNTQAHQEWQEAYEQKYEQLKVRLPSGWKERVQDYVVEMAAKPENKYNPKFRTGNMPSVNAFIIALLKEEIGEERLTGGADESSQT